MLEKLLERLKNQELTKDQEIELREELKQIDNQIESNIQSRRVDALVVMKNDEEKSKELDEIRSKLENVRKREKKRGLKTFLISIPIAFLFLGSLFGGMMITNMFNFGITGVLLSFAISIALAAGIINPLSKRDTKQHELYKKEESELLSSYEALIGNTVDKIASDSISSMANNNTVYSSFDSKDLDLEVALPEELIEESNIESF